MTFNPIGTGGCHATMMMGDVRGYAPVLVTVSFVERRRLMDARTVTHPHPSLRTLPVRPVRTHNRWARLGRVTRVLGSAILVLGLLYVGGTVAFHGAYDRWGRRIPRSTRPCPVTPWCRISRGNRP